MDLYMPAGLAALALLVLLNAALFVSLGRQGDERRRMIVQKASANTLAVVALYLAADFARDVVGGRRMEGVNAFVLLTVIAVVYFAHLLYYKRKFGG